LGLDEDAEGKEIKKAFRKLAIKYHPDKCSGKVEVEDYDEPIECATIMNRINLVGQNRLSGFRVMVIQS
jgi:curved DNA-binding protein CbpA